MSERDNNSGACVLPDPRQRGTVRSSASLCQALCQALCQPFITNHATAAHNVRAQRRPQLNISSNTR